MENEISFVFKRSFFRSRIGFENNEHTCNNVYKLTLDIFSRLKTVSTVFQGW